MGLFDFFKKKPAPAPANSVPKPENMLENLLMKGAQDAAFRMDFYRQLMTSTLFVLTNQTEARPWHTAQPGEKLSIRSWEDGSIPVFTSIPRIFDNNVIQEEIYYAELSSKAIFEMLKGARMMLNPFSQFRKELLPEEIEKLVDGSMFERGKTLQFKKNEKIQIGQPAVYPTEFINSLKKLYAETPAVRAAYLAWIYVPESGDPPHYIIALDMEHDFQTTCRDTGMTFENYSKTSEILDILPLDQSGLSSYFLKQQPFYRRS